MNTTRALALSLGLLLLGLFLLALSAPIARANPAILRVTVTGATAGACGNSWANPCGLQHALKDVATSGDEVWVASGTYTPTAAMTRTDTFQLQPGVALYGGFAMTETLRTQRDFTANLTILSGDIGTPGDSSDNAYHVVTGSGVTNTAVLDGFTVTRGYANDFTVPNDRGGGMYNLNGSPTLANVTFISNTTSGSGGGMYNDTSSPTLIDVTFFGNSASTGGGGGVYNWGSSPALSSTNFISNLAGSGGGMSNYALSGPMLTNTSFIGNSAILYGGGMQNFESSPALTNTTFISNTAASTGGGMYNDTSSPTLTNTIFISNTGYYGGGMSNAYSSSPVLTNTTFISNSVPTNGGAMRNYQDSSPTLTNVTFSGNSASLGAVIANYSNSNPMVRNTIIWGNNAPASWQIYNEASSSSLFDSVVQGGYPGGTNILTTDPLLGALGNWGGSTQTIPLLPGSSAIDAGNNATCAPTDQRGKSRVGTCDIGAFEFQGFTLTKISGDNQSTSIHTPFTEALKVALTETGSPLPLPGMTITFTAPSSGASAAWSGGLVQTATPNASGVATVNPPTANGIAGSYTVTATGPGASTPVTFALTNLLRYYLHLPLVEK